jgi:hypothetical protein
MIRDGGQTIILEPGERVDLFQPSGISRVPIVRPAPLPWYYACDPMILLVVITGVVMVPIALIIIAGG